MAGHKLIESSAGNSPGKNKPVPLLLAHIWLNAETRNIFTARILCPSGPVPKGTAMQNSEKGTFSSEVTFEVSVEVCQLEKEAPQ